MVLRGGTQFFDNAANTVTSPASGDLQQGTVLLIASFADVANVLRNVVRNDPLSTGAGISIFRTAANGTVLRAQIVRGAGTPQQVDTPASGLVVGAPMVYAVQWDIAGGSPTSYLARVGTPLSDVTTSPANGSGTHSGAGLTWLVGGTTAAAMTAWAFAVSSVRLTLAEMRAWQDEPTRPIRGAVVQWVLNEFGYARDLSGNGLHGVASGAIPHPQPLVLRPGYKRRSYLDAVPAAGGSVFSSYYYDTMRVA